MPRPWELKELPPPRNGGDIIAAAFDEYGAFEAWIEDAASHRGREYFYDAWQEMGQLGRVELYSIFCDACDYREPAPQPDLSQLGITVSDR